MAKNLTWSLVDDTFHDRSTSWKKERRRGKEKTKGKRKGEGEVKGGGKGERRKEKENGKRNFLWKP